MKRARMRCDRDCGGWLRLALRVGLGVLATFSLARSGQAATLQVNNLDGAGQGFNDGSAAQVASTNGGNPGRTLGEQRLLAFQYAADIWGALLTSSVTILIDARMSSLDCGADSAVLGSAAPTYAYLDENTHRWYPSPLADAVFGQDQDPGNADIEADFNQDVDTPQCLGNSDWYYGLDGNPPGNDVDFLSTVLHELAHGLGFISFADFDTGLGLDADPDAFSALILDSASGKTWPELDAAEIVQSARSVRGLVWAGNTVTQLARGILPLGAPSLSLDPVLDGFTGVIDQTDQGSVAAGTVTGPIQYVANACSLPADLSGKVVLFKYGTCMNTAQAQERGALAVLIDAGIPNSPPGDLDLGRDDTVTIPVWHINESDAALIEDALSQGELSATLEASASRLVGADADDHVLLNATNPSEEGSSVDHWDPLTRRTATSSERNRDLLMEPAGTSAGAELDLTVALFKDLGWQLQLCGDAFLDMGEECDEGSSNSSFVPDACRPNCRVATCGDHTLDTGEACDEGEANGSSKGSCRSDCQLSTCGNGQVEPNEQCDDGNANSDSSVDGCRTNCTKAHCGDLVIDSKEECDGTQLPLQLPAADAHCRANCTLGWCGDGLRDANEQCDDGSSNGSPQSNCTANCTHEVCGDGLRAGNEQCDLGERNSDITPNVCRTDCTLPDCGDGVRDLEEQCDDGNLSAGDGCSKTCENEAASIPNAGTDVGSMGGSSATGDDETSCSTQTSPDGTELDAGQSSPTGSSSASSPDQPERDASVVGPTDTGNPQPSPTTEPEPSDDAVTQTTPSAVDAGAGPALNADASTPAIPPKESNCNCFVGASAVPSARLDWLGLVALAAALSWRRARGASID